LSKAYVVTLKVSFPSQGWTSKWLGEVVKNRELLVENETLDLYGGAKIVYILWESPPSVADTRPTCAQSS